MRTARDAPAPLLLALAPEPACGARDGDGARAHAAYCRPDRRHAGQGAGEQAQRDAESGIPITGQVPVRHDHPRGAGRARIPGTPAADPADLAWHMVGRYRPRDALRRVGTLARADPPPP